MRLHRTLLPLSLILRASAQLLVLSDPTPPTMAQPNQQPLEALADSAPGPQSASSSILSDVLPSQKRINIFAGFTRDVASVLSRLESTSENTTLLAPLNTVLSSLPRKPWESPADYDKLGANAYSGSGGSERAAENLKRFTEAHVVCERPWEEGKKVKTLGGGEVWWESHGKDGGRRIMPGKVEVEGIVGKAGNGEVWMLRGVVDFRQ
ncbi:hypothetical protein B0A48_13809 [Cryoendolithus antarcticus]|uniref:FAS1 domain-containing protein n=1 Tax=Cryoendolithus antarcticus TaxID=1507870 RepID=A0A1V8SN09_9PEZI|nr:hypothetical protein B0A48_13809 [Cryoendolithus antarcticus]